jgi:NTE family protein
VTTAYVLSGGGSLGAVQVGMLQALSERDVTPDLVIGTSVGALNAAYLAGHGADFRALDDLDALWRSLRRSQVFPMEPLRMGAAALGRAPSLCRPAALRELIRHHLPFTRLEDAAIPVQVIATDVRSGSEVVLTQGDAVDAVMASAALPAVFPAVHIAGRDLIDGGVTDNAPISQAIASGADRIYVLPTGYACALDAAPATPLASILQALTLLVEQRLVFEVADLAHRADIRVVPPLCPLSVSSADFRHGAELIDRARASTRSWLDRPDTPTEHPEKVLSLHGHQHGHSASRRPHRPGTASPAAPQATPLEEGTNR